MLIDRVELRALCLPLREPLRGLSGEVRALRALLARVYSDEVWGQGELVVDGRPAGGSESVETAQRVARERLVPAILGRSFASAGEVAPALAAAARAHPLARSMLETAAWELEARLRGLPLARLLGGARAEVPAGLALPADGDEAAVLGRVERAADAGLARVSLEIAPGRDLGPLHAVRERFPSLPLAADAASAYLPADADALVELDSLGLLLLGQPYPGDELLALAGLQARLRTPISLGESAASPGLCEAALHLGAGRAVRIDPAAAGGHGPAKRLHDLCAARGVPAWCGGGRATGIGRAHRLALASLPGVTLPADVADDGGWERDLLAAPLPAPRGGAVAMPAGPGLGVETDEDYLAAVTEQCWEFTADLFSLVSVPAHLVQPLGDDE